MSNTDSLGEQIQRRFPEAKVVKTLRTMNAYLMVDPAQLAETDHTVFVTAMIKTVEPLYGSRSARRTHGRLDR